MRSWWGRLAVAVERVLAVMHENGLIDPGQKAIGDELQTATDRLGVLIPQQNTGNSVSRAVRGERRQEKSGMNTGLLRHVVSVARSAAIERPEVFGGIRIPPLNLNFGAYLKRVEGMLAAAIAYQDLLLKHGLEPGAIADLERAVGRLRQLSGAANDALDSQVGATAELGTVAGKIVELVRRLDGIYRYRLAGNPEKLAIWLAAFNGVIAVRRKGAETPPTDGVNKTA